MNRIIWLAAFVGLQAASFPSRAIDLEIAEAIPDVRLTVDVFWGALPLPPEADGDPNPWFEIVAVDEVDRVRFISPFPRFWGGDALILGSGLRFLRSEGSDLGAWGGEWNEGPGVFKTVPGVFRLDADYPGMLTAPTQLPAYAGLDAFGARFVFGAPYPDEQTPVSPVPEGRMWFSLIPLGLGVGVMSWRRQKQAAA